MSAAEPSGLPGGASPPLSRRSRQVMAVLWPAFLIAGVLEMLVFALVDPGQLRWFGARALDLPAEAVYTLAFFGFWAVAAIGGALTLLLSQSAADINR